MGEAANDPRPETDLLDCDVVFRGGVTSGVVYPGAVAALAARYRFRSIGGASAGAIAAGIAAAAEYGRRTGCHADPFAEVEHLAAEVGGAGSGLRRLFRASPRLRTLEWLLWAVLGRGAADLALGGFLLALAIAAAGWAVFGTPWAGLALALALPLLLTAWLVLGPLRRLPAEGFGLCPGIHPGVPQTAAAMRRDGALMDWMHATIQRLAGRSVGRVAVAGPGGAAAVPTADRPLTMGDLWDPAGDGAAGDPLTAAREIDLVLTTTNLSQQLAHQFPFLERVRGALYFRPEELARVLPRDVVRWMETTARRDAADDAATAEAARAAGLLRLPAPRDLPVLFGVRLSLSFPGLIAAVRLHAQGEDADGRAHAIRPCWFSDGGLTSNFPISVFDSPLPGRPTFCIDLRGTGTPGDAAASGARPSLTARLAAADRRRRQPGRDRRGPAAAPPVPPPPVRPGESPDPLVVMADSNRAAMAPLFRGAIDGSLAGFLGAVVATARHAHENELMLMPGHRDRIAHVLTRPDEGGLNLAMPPATIAALSARGRTAGELLVSRFHPAGAAAQAGFVLGWPNQRWVRYRSTMAALERFLADLERGWQRPPAGAPTYAEALAHSAPNDPANASSVPPGRRAVPSYRWASAAAAAAAERQTAAVLDLAAGLRREATGGQAGALGSVFDGVIVPDGRDRGRAPQPKLGLRQRPLGTDPGLLRSHAEAAPGPAAAALTPAASAPRTG